MSSDTLTQADSGFTPENIADAEWLWANLPTFPTKFHDRPTYEKALICHTVDRFRRMVLARHRADAEPPSARITGNKDRESPVEGAHPAEPAQAVEALRQALAWHENQDKAISKQPRANEGDNGWRRHQHQEQAEMIRAALASMGEHP